MKRLDLRLVSEGMAPSRTRAQQLIESGEVEIRSKDGWIVATQASLNTESLSSTQIRVKEAAQLLRYVSRGGLKLEAALVTCQLGVQGWRCLDVGQSTGGFTDCLLQNGASQIFGFDVGHSQLDAKLSADSRVTSEEGLHVKDLPESTAFKQFADTGIDFIVIDVSFISLTRVLPDLVRALPKPVQLLALVKPQFEVGRQTLSVDHVPEVQANVLASLKAIGYEMQRFFPCAVLGQDGTQEYFLYAVPCTTP
jgi:23S rRNA (cytidine1920-2'-O)/16S rRNA (cytidine1409-2'-O)-methyltransferase